MWTVIVKKKQQKGLGKLPVEVRALFKALVKDLQLDGPVRPDWDNYSKLGGSKHHCHLNYRYVACWTSESKTITIEVYYVGSRENAPY
jgi:mRNA-degrading endonuclease RelE of RelBE toxin-antitoxin system